MVKTPCFHCRGAWVQFLVRELRSLICHTVWGKKKKVTVFVFLLLLVGLNFFHTFIDHLYFFFANCFFMSLAHFFDTCIQILQMEGELISSDVED